MGNIVVNGLFLNDYSSGVHRTAYQLINALSMHNSLSHSLAVLMCHKSEVSLCESKQLKLKALPWDTRNPLSRIIRENLALPSLLKSNGYGLYHSLNYVLPYSIPIPGIVTVHDIISLQFPQYCKNSSVIYHYLFMKRSFRQAKKIIAVSNKVKEDLVSAFGISENKIDVIYHGIDGGMKRVEDKQQLDTVAGKYDLPKRFVLFVGNIEPKKNLSRVVEAFELLKRQQDSDHKLVLISRKGWKYRSVLTRIRNSEVRNDIMMLGLVGQDELPVFYSLADLLVFPSLYEGFGLPPLEAMACGTPVVASRVGSLPEITGSNCVLVDPFNSHEIMWGMKTIMDDPSLKDRLVQSGLNWVKQFRWSDTAAATINVYNALA